MPPHPLINFEMQRNYQDEPKFNDVYSRNDLSFVKRCTAQIKDIAYVINLGEYKSTGTYYIDLYVNGNKVT